jgi:universal stress protein E
MRAIKHVLVVVDPTSDVQHCVQKGARVARALGAAIELFICDYESGVFPGLGVPREVLDEAWKQRHAQAEDRLRWLAEPLRESGLKVLTDYSRRESLHAGVVDKVRKYGADLVVKDTHFHGAISRALFTNADWHLIRECPAPLLLTKPAQWNSPVRVAAALDPGHADDKPAGLDHELLDVAADLAGALQGEMRAVHVFDPLPIMAGMASPGSGIGAVPMVDVELIDSLRKYHDKEFRAVVARHSGFEGHADLIEGPPVTALPDYVTQNKIDVLVTGAVSRSVIRRLLVGSTAERLLDRLPCDILVVKPVPGLAVP